MHTYYLSNEQRELLADFAREVLDEMTCKLSDDINSPLDPYDEAGNFDHAKLSAMVKCVADEIKSHT